MRKREEYLSEAQDIFENMEFNEYVVEGMDGWQLDLYKLGPLIAEANLVVYLYHPDHEANEPTERAHVTVTFDSKTDCIQEAYCTNEYGDTIAEVNVKEYLSNLAATKLHHELENKIIPNKTKIKI